LKWAKARQTPGKNPENRRPPVNGQPPSAFLESGLLSPLERCLGGGKPGLETHVVQFPQVVVPLGIVVDVPGPDGKFNPPCKK
jgi:hypothetical protein